MFYNKLVNKLQLADEYRRAHSRLLLLDYDGVLAPIMPLPEQAAPSQRTYELLAKLAADKKNTCVVISGRDRQTLEDWLGHLPLAFAAEHGTWRREMDGVWERIETAIRRLDWKREIRAVMEQYSAMLDGAFIEEKTAGVGIHYRTVRNQTEAEARMRQLVQELSPIAERLSLRILHGKKVIEVIPENTSKGAAARTWLGKSEWPFILAAGDDVTDEALFQEVPERAWTIKVGEGETLARERIGAQPEFIQLLESLVVL